MASIIEEIKQSVDIVEYIGQFVPLTVKSQNYVGLCPFHQDSDPSFKVSPAKNIFKCFGCGKGGNIFNFVTLYHKVDFGEAIRILSDYIGADVETEFDEYYKQMAIWHEHFRKSFTHFAFDYCGGRNIDTATLNHFEVGFIPEANVLTAHKVISLEDMLKLGVVYQLKTGLFRYKFPGCLTFPFFDDQDRVVGFSFMRIDRRKDEPKYENSWTTPIFKRRELFFGLKQNKNNIKNSSIAYLVEGYFDLMRLYQVSDRKIAVAICGSTVTDEQVKLISRYANLIRIHFDGDEAGRDGAIKSAFKFEEVGSEVFIGDYPDGTDPDSYYSQEHNVQIHTLDVPAFYQKYKGENTDAADVLMAHASRVRNLDTVEYYVKAIKGMYPNIPTSLITARMSKSTAISTGYKHKESEFSIQKELVKAMLQGLISPSMFDENKFSNELRSKILLLKVNKDEHGFIDLDTSIMGQFTEFLEPLKVAVEELPKLAIPYREYQNIEELIKAKKELHN